jgi:hypothetical protein
MTKTKINCEICDTFFTKLKRHIAVVHEEKNRFLVRFVAKRTPQKGIL